MDEFADLDIDCACFTWVNPAAYADIEANFLDGKGNIDHLVNKAKGPDGVGLWEVLGAMSRERPALFVRAMDDSMITYWLNSNGHTEAANELLEKARTKLGGSPEVAELPEVIKERRPSHPAAPVRRTMPRDATPNMQCIL